MEPLCRTAHRHPFHLPLFSKPLISSPPLLKPFPCSSSTKPCPSLRASCSSKSSSNSLAPVIKIASVAAATSIAAAALFLARLCPPALAAAAAAAAAAPPAPAVQSDALPSDASSETTPLTEAEKERILEERLDSHPDDVRSLRALMELKVKAGKLAEAIGIVDRLVALEPAEKDLPLLKAHLQSYDGDTETAKRGFEELLEKDPFLVEAYHGLIMATSQSEDDGDLDAILKRVEDAMELCKKARRKEDLRDFKLLMAQIRVIEGRYEDSLKIYKELVKEEPRDFRPYLCQGIIYTLLRKKDEAEKQFQTYRRLVPKGHPYAQYFDDNMIAMKVFGQMDENRRKAALKN
ncbi:protein SLOW GREEN 1, chloroplastic [Musa acuminata AAA Group]|uniref:protein SLOW GREEN 1, chloroplastic n=1 Tax=Musa acuminata AAA Group TaxID=214697 RepID=UPI0031CDAFD7